MPRDYEKSPRQRLEWFGGSKTMTLSTSTSNGGAADQNVIITSPVRLALSAGTVDDVAFPAGIVRGESCSIARFIGHLSVYDVDRRQQNVSFMVGAGLIKLQVEDEFVRDPASAGSPSSAPDAATDLRASWLWHKQSVWNPQSAGANYTVFDWSADIDSTNSRIFESNDVLQLSVEAVTLVNSGSAVSVDARCTLMWRALMRLD